MYSHNLMTGHTYLHANSIHIWRIDLDGPTHDISSLLSADETKRAEGIKQAQTRDRFIHGRVAMRSILSGYLGVVGDKLTFIQHEKGKPAISPPYSDIEFNLSHCENMALLAVTKQIPIGIDLEFIRPRPSQLKIAQRMFPEPIYKELQKQPSDQFDTAFFRHWTELEARAKCAGDGIFAHDGWQANITSRHFYPQDGWMACVATQGTDISTLELKNFVYRK